MSIVQAAVIMLSLCFYPSLQSTVNIVFDRVGKVDPVTRGIEIAVNYMGINFDVSPPYAISHSHAVYASIHYAYIRTWT